MRRAGLRSDDRSAGASLDPRAPPPQHPHRRLDRPRPDHPRLPPRPRGLHPRLHRLPHRALPHPPPCDEPLIKKTISPRRPEDTNEMRIRLTTKGTENTEEVTEKKDEE